MGISNKVAATMIAGFLISAPYVHAQASSPEDGAKPISHTSLAGSSAIGFEGADTNQQGLAPSSLCSGTDGAANRAMDGFKLEDFAPAALASLTPCELNVLEAQIGVGRGAEATLNARHSGRLQLTSIHQRR